MGRLIKGNKSIDFKMKDYLDNEISLSTYKGEKVFLTFYRGATCPFCNMKIQELIRKYPEFEEKGIKIIAFFTSSKEEMLKYVGRQKPPFIMIPDPKLEMYKKYKIETLSWGPLKTLKNPKKLFKAMFGGFFNPKAMLDEPTIPADFLIDENQNIYKTYYGKDFADHIDIDEVLTWKQGDRMVGNSTLEIVLSKHTVTTATKVALVVGTILALINHGPNIVNGTLTSFQMAQIIITYFVPYSVSTYSCVKSIKKVCN